MTSSYPHNFDGHGAPLPADVMPACVFCQQTVDSVCQGCAPNSTMQLVGMEYWRPCEILTSACGHSCHGCCLQQRNGRSQCLVCQTEWEVVAKTNVANLRGGGSDEWKREVARRSEELALLDQEYSSSLAAHEQMRRRQQHQSASASASSPTGASAIPHLDFNCCFCSHSAAALCEHCIAQGVPASDGCLVVRGVCAHYAHRCCLRKAHEAAENLSPNQIRRSKIYGTLATSPSPARGGGGGASDDDFFAATSSASSSPFRKSAGGRRYGTFSFASSVNTAGGSRSATAQNKRGVVIYCNRCATTGNEFRAVDELSRDELVIRVRSIGLPQELVLDPVAAGWVPPPMTTTGAAAGAGGGAHSSSSSSPPIPPIPNNNNSNNNNNNTSEIQKTLWQEMLRRAGAQVGARISFSDIKFQPEGESLGRFFARLGFGEAQAAVLHSVWHMRLLDLERERQEQEFRQQSAQRLHHHQQGSSSNGNVHFASSIVPAASSPPIPPMPSSTTAAMRGGGGGARW